MPQVPILMPQLGESIAEATIMRLLVQPGDEVQADQEVIEVETNKAVMGVTVSCAGKVTSITVAEGETVAVGAVMGIIEATAEEVEAWLALVAEIKPRSVMVYTIDRDTPAPNLEKVSVEELRAIADKVKALGVECSVAG